MNRWTRVNLILGAIAAMLLVLHLWPQQVAAPIRLTLLDVGTISTVRIEHAGGLQIALQRSTDGWELVHPGRAKARSHRVEQLLSIDPTNDDAVVKRAELRFCHLCDPRSGYEIPFSGLAGCVGTHLERVLTRGEIWSAASRVKKWEQVRARFGAFRQWR